MLDTPPVLAVTDAVILAPLVNGVVFVIGAEMTRRRLAERALETIMSAPPRFEPRRGARAGAGPERHLMSTGDEAVGKIGDDAFDAAVVPRRHGNQRIHDE